MLWPFRKSVGTALALNTAIFAGEAIAGFTSNSLALLQDAAHNFSDELSLVGLCLAFYLADELSRHAQRIANLLNSVGLIGLSLLLIAEALLRLWHPLPVHSLVPALFGILAALLNGTIALQLREVGRHNATARLAYLHNLGDVWISLAPVCWPAGW